MKKMLIAGFTVLAVIALIAGCANPLTDADGGVLAVTDLTASAAHDSADISWVEPNGDFASAEVTVSAEGQDDITRTVDKGEAQVSLDSLVPETTYTVSVALVAANGTVSEKAVSKEFTTPAVPAPVAAVIVDITFVGVENGKDYALVGNNYDGFLGATWDENHMATTASNSSVTFTLNATVDTAELGKYEWKTTLAGQWDQEPGNLGGDVFTFDGLDIDSGNFSIVVFVSDRESISAYNVD